MKHTYLCVAFFCVKAFLNRLLNGCREAPHKTPPSTEMLKRESKETKQCMKHWSSGYFQIHFIVLFCLVRVPAKWYIRNFAALARIFHVQRSLQFANRVENKMPWKESVTYIISASFSSNCKLTKIYHCVFCVSFRSSDFGKCSADSAPFVLCVFCTMPSVTMQNRAELSSSASETIWNRKHKHYMKYMKWEAESEKWLKWTMFFEQIKVVANELLLICSARKTKWTKQKL